MLVFAGLFAMSATTLAAEQTLYVDGELVWVDYGTYVHGPIDSPYLTITEAINAMDADGGTIYVAEGTYDEDLTFSNLNNITILGGYNGGPGDSNPFTVQDTSGQKSTVNGKITGTSVSGKISGLTFSGQTASYLIAITNSSSGYNFEVSDNAFAFDSTTNYFIKVSSDVGSSGLIKDNLFTWAASDQSIIDTGGFGTTVVEKNHFNFTASKSGSYGIIRATDGAVVKNNLIQDSGADNRVAIRISNSAEVYNNTIVGGTATTAAIASSGSGHTVYNNLVANVTGSAFALAAGATEASNYTDTECDPAFVGGSGTDGYKLGASSTCLDLGQSVSSVNDDYFGTSRPSGGGYDVGFSEFYVAPACGNTFVEAGEQCDDGNTTDGDGCDSSCNVESSSPVCGNNIVESGEQCDDGNTTNGDGCDSTCVDEASNPVCGNNIVESGEQCDDGNTTNGDGCDSSCADEAVVVDCGDWYDINSSDSHYSVAVYLCEHGEIIRGDSFGNLRIDDLLTRAELLAMAFRAREYKNFGVVDTSAEACFLDVTDQWFAQYFCTAKDEGFVEGYAGNVAKPGNTVLLGEGLKMFMGALEESYTIGTDCWYCNIVDTADANNWLPYTFSDPTEVGGLEIDRRNAMDILYRMLTN